MWGKTELIDWVSYDGDSLQGFIIKPENFDPTKHYPLIIEFYERFSQNMYNFVQPKVSHWPNADMYTGDGYMVLMPDIKFKTGSPGKSAINCLVSGCEKADQNGPMLIQPLWDCGGILGVAIRLLT